MAIRVPEPVPPVSPTLAKIYLGFFAFTTVCAITLFSYLWALIQRIASGNIGLAIVICYATVLSMLIFSCTVYVFNVAFRVTVRPPRFPVLNGLFVVR